MQSKNTETAKVKTTAMIIPKTGSGSLRKWAKAAKKEITASNAESTRIKNDCLKLSFKRPSVALLIKPFKFI